MLIKGCIDVDEVVGSMSMMIQVPAVAYFAFKSSGLISSIPILSRFIIVLISLELFLCDDALH